MTHQDVKTEREDVEYVEPKNRDAEAGGVDEEYDPAAVAALVWKQDLRIVPLSAVIYLLCYLDRSNIGTDTLQSSWTACQRH
ncbi:hypothetical protein BJY00DRAFT_287074 [Aspergillus carlsbadensis]|nr:hypothetical protein BJY00DRAFT_287074 [Aspergillus carlsbadensis]